MTILELSVSRIINIVEFIRSSRQSLHFVFLKIHSNALSSKESSLYVQNGNDIIEYGSKGDALQGRKEALLLVRIAVYSDTTSLPEEVTELLTNSCA